MIFTPITIFPVMGRLVQGRESCCCLPSGSSQIITDVIGNPEEERRAAFYHQPWAQEAVGRHIFAKVRLCLFALLWHESSRGLSCLLVSSPGAAAEAGTGTGAGNPPDLTAQGPLSLEGDHPLGLQTWGKGWCEGVSSPVTVCSPALVS